MKHCFFIYPLLLIVGTASSQRIGCGVFATGMFHSYYDTYDSPHHGSKSGMTPGGGINFTFYKEGNSKDNLRVNSFDVSFYQKETDSIHAMTYDTGSAPVINFYGTQTVRYTFLRYSHSNYLQVGESPFLYCIIGIQLGGILNKSSYNLPGYDPSQHYLDPSWKGELPKKTHGAFGGFHVGMAYEFQRFFLTAEGHVDYPFFRFPYYSLGLRLAFQAGITIPIDFKRK
ncbi:MAG: hypothetical protein M3R17_13170 [Bacteroidota bacterium]|nr:hypothetical protein [Bacteroidota bacterium]